jgi:hypothetical protein
VVVGIAMAVSAGSVLMVVIWPSVQKSYDTWVCQRHELHQRPGRRNLYKHACIWWPEERSDTDGPSRRHIVDLGTKVRRRPSHQHLFTRGDIWWPGSAATSTVLAIATM